MHVKNKKIHMYAYVGTSVSVSLDSKITLTCINLDDSKCESYCF